MIPSLLRSRPSSHPSPGTPRSSNLAYSFLIKFAVWSISLTALAFKEGELKTPFPFKGDGLSGGCSDELEVATEPVDARNWVEEGAEEGDCDCDESTCVGMGAAGSGFVVAQREDERGAVGALLCSCEPLRDAEALDGGEDGGRAREEVEGNGLLLEPLV